MAMFNSFLYVYQRVYPLKWFMIKKEALVLDRYWNGLWQKTWSLMKPTVGWWLYALDSWDSLSLPLG